MTLCFSILLFCLSINSSLFAQDSTLDGVAGIPWGASPDQVKKTMLTRGATLSRSDSTSMIFDNGRYGDFSAYYWSFNFGPEGLYIGTVGLEDENPRMTIALYDRVVSKLIDKYGTPDTQIVSMDSLYRDHPNKSTLIKTGRAKYSTEYRFNTANNSGNWLTVGISDKLVVRVTYMNGAMANKLEEAKQVKKQQDY